jgi:hypothetical protein
MVYLNFILTVLCLILLTFLVGIIYFWKKIGKKLVNKVNNNPFIGNSPNIGDPKQMAESMKIIGSLFKNLPKR